MEPDPDETVARFRSVAEATIDDLLEAQPEWATALGDHRFDDRLDDLSESGIARLRSTLTRDRDELDSLDLDELGPEDAVDAEILRSGIDAVLLSVEVLAEHTWNPLVWLPGEALFPLLERSADVPVPDRLRAIASRLEQIPEPVCGAGQVKIAPKFCGICGTDLHEYLGGANLIPAPGHPHPITGETLPLTLGHEFSGVVVEVGAGVAHVRAGDRVCVQPTIYDGDCRACVRGLVNCCDQNGFLGLSGWGGGMSEFMACKASMVKKLPDNVSLELGALIEPLAVGWHAVKISPYKEGDSVLVLGGGPIGLSVVQTLVGKGCKNIIVSEVSKRRRQFASDFGAHHTIDPLQDNVVEEVGKLTNGQGADVAFDAAGVQVGLDSAMQAIKARGMLVNIAVWEKRATLAMNDLVFRERAYMGIATYALGDFEEVLEAISSGAMKPEGMITKKIKMNEVAEQGFKALVDDKDNQVKILVDVGAGI